MKTEAVLSKRLAELAQQARRLIFSLRVPSFHDMSATCST